ncbi:MAG: hypothetical protein Q7R56_01185 [Nanoarchaeota archaeon]|nr:hypothetical protein [Nanoarchaeota archaeon]
MNKEPYGTFCELFGATPKNRILEEYFTFGKGDYPINGIAENTGVKKSTAYKIATELINKGYLLPTRKIGGMQFYKLNQENPDIQLLLQIDKLILQQLGKAYEQQFKKTELVTIRKSN